MAVAERLLQNGLFDLRSDKSLVRAAQSGRSDAYAALVTRYYPKVYSFVSHLLSTYRHRASAPSAEDLTQEVFTKALNALARFNGDYRFGPWLLRIARNLCVDETRRDSHRAEPADPIELCNMEPAAAARDDVWESISKSEVVEVVRKALSRLPMRQRTVLILREIEGWSYADIAPVVGTNVRGVEATLRRARARFRLEASNFETDESERAICRRVAHLAAAEPSRFTQTERAHIERCDKCRLRTSRIRSAEKLFGLLPPLAPASWDFSIRSAFDAIRSKRSVRSGVREGFFSRDGVMSFVASPISHLVEAVGAVAVAAAVVVSAAPASRVNASTASLATIEVMTPILAPVPSASVVRAGTYESAAKFAEPSSYSWTEEDMEDFSDESLIERVLPIVLLGSRPNSAPVATDLVASLNLDSWEPTDVASGVVDLSVTAVDDSTTSLGMQLDATDPAGATVEDLAVEPTAVANIPISISSP